MSAIWIEVEDSRLARLYFEAERRGLDYRLTADLNVIEVTSYTRKGLWHRVELFDSKVRCFCESSEGKACTHQALAVSHWRRDLWFKWFTEDCAKFIKFDHKINTGASLTRSERIRLNKAIRARALMPERAKAA